MLQNPRFYISGFSNISWICRCFNPTSLGPGLWTWLSLVLGSREVRRMSHVVWGKEGWRWGLSGENGVFPQLHKGRSWPLLLTGSMKLNLTRLKGRVVHSSPFPIYRFPWSHINEVSGNWCLRFLDLGFSFPVVALISTSPRTPFLLPPSTSVNIYKKINSGAELNCPEQTALWARHDLKLVAQYRG